ncbi:hypothetical protein JCM19232_4641 [Vibrio ishigakensis]|uniref:Uncharacterized protein n=1 Tax=Vibrio ishigakensis TaxID=1481914 RepID=A0A0B8PJR0_9VIBR|nr:hypothetical protein JCM19232_4641 [Vibrio ishigakensis]
MLVFLWAGIFGVDALNKTVKFGTVKTIGYGDFTQGLL